MSVPFVPLGPAPSSPGGTAITVDEIVAGIKADADLGMTGLVAATLPAAIKAATRTALTGRVRRVASGTDRDDVVWEDTP